MFKSRSKSFLGIDIGNYSIKIIEIEKKGNSIELNNYGESFSETPFGPFQKKSFSFSNEEVAERIKTTCQEAEIKTKKVNFAIPDFYTFFTSIDLPLMGKTELPQAIEYEIRPHVPLPISEVTLDWNVIEGTVGKTPLKILVAAVSNDIVEQYKEIAKLSGLTPELLEPEVFSLARLLRKESEKETVGLVEIGIKSTTCTIVEKGLVKTSHSFSVGGNELTEALTRSLNINYNEGERIKREKGLTESPNREALLPLVDSIIEEIKKVFRNYYSEKGREVERVVLAGGSIAMPGLKDYLSEKTKKKMEIIDPFAEIVYPDILKQELKKRGPFYAISLGVALKGFEK